MPVAKPVTPRQAAMYGHIAAALRAVCEKNQWSPGDLNERLKRPRGHSALYHWLRGTGAPDLKNRKKLAKLTGIPEHELTVRELSAQLPAVVTSSPGVSRTSIPDNVLSFTVNTQGDARLRLDVTLPVAQALPLFRLITDHAELKRRLVEHHS